MSVSLHHDISTVTGEEVVLFTLAESPTRSATRRGSRGLESERFRMARKPHVVVNVEHAAKPTSA